MNPALQQFIIDRPFGELFFAVGYLVSNPAQETATVYHDIELREYTVVSLRDIITTESMTPTAEPASMERTCIWYTGPQRSPSQRRDVSAVRVSDLALGELMDLFDNERRSPAPRRTA